MIQTSVAHLYHSALPFAPQTPLWDTYRARMTSVEARILQGRETEWTSLVRTALLPRSGVAVEYSHDGHMLAVVGYNFSQLLWSGTGERLAELDSGSGNVESVSFSCDDRLLATTSGSTVRLWDIASGSLITALDGRNANIYSVDFHPYIGHLLAAGDSNGRVYVWDMRDGSRTDFKVAGSTGRLCWVQQREQRRIIVRSKDGRMEMWGVERAQQVQIFSSSPTEYQKYAVVSSNDGSLVASDAADGMLAVYSTHTGEVVHSYKIDIAISSVAFSPTLPILAFGSGWGFVGLWFYTTNRIVAFTRHSLGVSSIAFSPNGRFVASTSHDRTLHISETDAADPAPDDIHHSQYIHNVTFSNDGQFIVSASMDSTVKVWNAYTGTLCTTFRGHVSSVYGAIILPNNVHVVSRDDNGVLMVWDWQTGETLFTDIELIAREHGRFDNLFPYTHTLFPLGFISTHIKSQESATRTICCWTIDLSVPGDTRVVLVARGIVHTLDPRILQIMYRSTTATAKPTLVVECSSGEKFSALWDGPTVVDNSPTQLQFIKELEKLPLKNTWPPPVGLEVPCRWSDDRAWILGEHDRQILWVPPSNRGYGRWCGHRLVMGSINGRITLVDFSDVTLNDDIEF
jgi:WD40 repeat protein